ncbi:MAG: hypothetical protein KDB80_06380 [Planctomycetes bacterium]|nr:hypothetical protein [Planctomycetota bacterium]
MPRLHPVGEDLEFRWSWDGADPSGWIVEVQNESFDTIFRSEVIDGRSFRAPESLRAMLRSGGRFHWFVEAQPADGPRSAPIGFDLR